MQTGFPGSCYEEMMESAFARKVKRNKDDFRILSSVFFAQAK